jgi:hypothetical protein
MTTVGGGNEGSAWHHTEKVYGGMGEQTAGANGAIAVKMTGGKRRRQSKKQSRRGDKRQSKKHSQKGGKRHSRKQKGGRR